MKRFQYLVMLNMGFMILFALSAFASGEKGYPQENVKLTGKLYTFPINIEGSPYLQEEWQVGNLYLENGKTALNVKIKFNIINNDLIFYQEILKRLFVADRETIKSFVINPGRQDSTIFVKYNGPEVGYKLKKNDFVQELYQGKIFFMVKHTGDIINATETNSKDKVYTKNIYYVNFNNHTYEIKLSNRSVYSLFPSKKKELRRLMSENRLRHSSVENLIKLFNLIELSGNFNL